MRRFGVGVATVAAGIGAAYAPSAKDRQRARDTLRDTSFAVTQHEAAARALDEHGVVAIRCILKESDMSTRGYDVAGAAEAVGVAVAAMLPTIHQADAWVRSSMGKHAGQRAAAFAFASQPPTLDGCAHAVAQLEPHAARRWPRRSWVLTPDDVVDGDSSSAGRGWRSLLLQSTPVELDALAQLATRTARGLAEDAEVRVGSVFAEDDQHEGVADAPLPSPLASVSPGAVVLRAWSEVLVAPAALWRPMLEACASRRQQHLVQQRVSLLVRSADPPAVATEAPPAPQPAAPAAPAPAPAAPAAMAAALALPRRLRHSLLGALWPRVSAPNGLVLLLPVDTSAAARVHATGSAAASTGTAAAGEEPAAAPDGGAASAAPLLVVDVLLPSMGDRVPAVRVRVPCGGALAVDGRARWRLVDDEISSPEAAPRPAADAAAATCCVLFEYRPAPADEPPAAASEVAVARAADFAAVLWRGALAWAVGGPEGA